MKQMKKISICYSPLNVDGVRTDDFVINFNGHRHRAMNPRLDLEDWLHELILELKESDGISHRELKRRVDAWNYIYPEEFLEDE